MNYSKSIRRKQIGKRIIISWCVIAGVFFLLGLASGYALKGHISHRKVTETEIRTDTQYYENPPVFGANNKGYFIQEITLDFEWKGGNDFERLPCGMSGEEQEFLYYLCEGYNLDFTLVMALIQAESECNPRAVSPSNDYGYMQINRINHEWLKNTLGITDFLDPYENMRAGCFILRGLFERYEDTELVLMCYNLGETGASRLWEKGIYSIDYTDIVLDWQKEFQAQLGGGE